MSLEIYLAFVVAATVLIISPGPSVMLVLSHSMSAGARRAMFTISGEALSHALFLGITTLGLAPVMLASAELFSWMKWVGAAYLVWMGIQQWRAGSAPSLPSVRAHSPASWSFFLQGFTVDMTNPKALVFYAAFFPPFLDASTPATPQLAVLGTTFLLIFVVVSIAYALLAARTRKVFRRPAQLRVLNRVTGSLLVGAGMALSAVTSD